MSPTLRDGFSRQDGCEKADDTYDVETFVGCFIRSWKRVGGTSEKNSKSTMKQKRRGEWFLAGKENFPG